MVDNKITDKEIQDLFDKSNFFDISWSKKSHLIKFYNEQKEKVKLFISYNGLRYSNNTETKLYDLRIKSTLYNDEIDITNGLVQDDFINFISKAQKEIINVDKYRSICSKYKDKITNIIKEQYGNDLNISFKIIQDNIFSTQIYKVFNINIEKEGLRINKIPRESREFKLVEMEASAQNLAIDFEQASVGEARNPCL